MKYKSIELKIKEILKERGLQQKFICEKIAIPPQIFSYCMCGKRKFKVWEFISICELLKLDFAIFKNCFKKVD